jgi:DNA-directed RNA polymerase subunit H (RpoH/RPB5)
VRKMFVRKKNEFDSSRNVKKFYAIILIILFLPSISFSNVKVKKNKIPPKIVKIFQKSYPAADSIVYRIIRNDDASISYFIGFKSNTRILELNFDEKGNINNYKEKFLPDSLPTHIVDSAWAFFYTLKITNSFRIFDANNQIIGYELYIYGDGKHDRPFSSKKHVLSFDFLGKITSFGYE